MRQKSSMNCYLSTKYSNKLKMMKLLIVVVVVSFLSVACNGDGEATNGAVRVTNMAMEGVKRASAMGAEKITNLADGISVRVERFTNPAEHQPQQHNLASSAIRGVGRLIRNMTVETGRFIGTVGSAGMRLGARIPAAAINTVREAATRISSPRRSNSGQQGTDSSAEASQDAAVVPEGGETPDELKKND